eukprot:6818615-Lingulodinium_polyedra.AAC.1
MGKLSSTLPFSYDGPGKVRDGAGVTRHRLLRGGRGSEAGGGGGGTSAAVCCVCSVEPALGLVFAIRA